MKHSFLAVFVFIGCLAMSCMPYTSYLTVTDQTIIPDGTKALVIQDNIDNVKAIFKENGIGFVLLEGGADSEEILIDEGTRAMYKLREIEGTVKVTAFWGITQKVKSNMVVWAGYAAASAYDVHSWDMVVYDKASKRPKKVFDYMYQILHQKYKRITWN